MKAFEIILLLALASVGHFLQFNTEIPSYQRFCFYEVLQAQQKYSFAAKNTLQYTTFEVEITNIQDRAWKTVFHRNSEKTQKQIIVNKYASISTTFSFCVLNQQSQPVHFQISFHSGLDMMELHTLPDSNDSENMQRELNWLQQQVRMLDQKASNIDELRRINTQIHGMVGVKMIGLAVVGLCGILAVNILFNKLLKNELRKRKLI